MAGRDRILQLVSELLLVMKLARLAGGCASSAQHDRTADDRRREDDAEHNAADDAPAEATSRAVISGLLNLQRAVVLTLDDDDALDLKMTAVFDRLQHLVGVPGGLGVVEVGDEQGVGTIADCDGFDVHVLGH